MIQHGYCFIQETPKLMSVERIEELPSDEYSNLPPFNRIGGVEFCLHFVLAMNIALIV